MAKISVNSNSEYLLKDNQPFFFLSDTVWMAFQKLSLKEWRELVRFRKEQGFDGLQISVLPIAHDNSTGEDAIEPFALSNGAYDFNRINEGYFQKAEEMLKIMKEYDMIPFLHLFWVNYIPDTWAAKRSPGTVIPFEKIEPLTEYFLDRFDKYDPVYSVSGDTSFETETVIKYYLKILDLLHKKVPHRVTTLHLQPEADPPKAICEHPQYQFYAYQSGHGVGVNQDGSSGAGQNSMVAFSKQFLQKQTKKPIINTEICYEGHGHGFSYGRFYPLDIRKAIWKSILSGAKAGVTYGAHGLWQMYESGAEFNNTEFSRMPYVWGQALRFPGAYDAAYAKWIFENYSMWELQQFETLEGYGNQIQMGRSSEKIVIYLPYNDDLVLPENLSEYKFEAISLESRHILHPFVSYSENQTFICRMNVNEDILLIGIKNRT